MTTCVELIETAFPIRRPRILVTSARLSARRYDHQPDLPTAALGPPPQSAVKILAGLIEAEARWEDERCAKSARYRPSKHVEALAAVIAETRAQLKASGSAALRSAI